MEASRLIVIRHGETEWNVRGVWQGQKNSPLTEKGMQQAELVAKRVADFGISTLYSSDLGRCLQSVEPTARALNLEIKTDVRLRERGFGVLEGLSKEESQAKYPGIWQSLSRKDINFAPEGGESLFEKQKRFEGVYSEIAQNHHGETVLVFTHGGGVDAIVRMALRIPLEFERVYTLWNCAINVFQFSNEKWVVDTLGETAHLGDFASAFRPR